MRLKLCCLLGLAFGLVAIAVAASAATDWPSRPVKFLLPLGAGSGSDIGARLFADRLSARWGQPVVVENRPGGDALVAINAFVTARDDHVLLFSPSSSFTAHPYLHDNLPYKPSDLVPITRVSNTFITLSVPADLNVGSLAELVAHGPQGAGQAQLGGRDRRARFHVCRLAQERRIDDNQGPVSQPGRCGQRSRRGAGAGLRGGAGDRAAGARGRKDQGAGRDQHRALAGRSEQSRRCGKPATRR